MSPPEPPTRRLLSLGISLILCGVVATALGLVWLFYAVTEPGPASFTPRTCGIFLALSVTTTALGALAAAASARRAPRSPPE